MRWLPYSNLSHGHFIVVEAPVAAADEVGPQLEVGFTAQRSHELGVGDGLGTRAAREFERARQDIGHGPDFQDGLVDVGGQHLRDGDVRGAMPGLVRVGHDVCGVGNLTEGNEGNKEF